MYADTKEFPRGTSPIDLARELPLLVLPEHALFPGGVQRLDLATPEARALVEAFAAEAPAQAGPALVALFLERDALPASPTRLERGPIGLLARVLKTMGLASGNLGIELEGLVRVQLAEVTRAKPHRSARLAAVSEVPASDADARRLFERLKTLAKGVIQHMPELGSDAAALVDAVPDPGKLADLAGANLDLALEERATLLAAVDVKERLRRTVDALARKLERLEQESAALAAKPLQPLWPFEPGAEQRLVRSVREGKMSADEATRIRDFVARGFTVWERLLTSDQVDALLADVASIRAHPGHFVTTNHRNSMPYRYSGADFDSYESIFDVYVNFESARAACFHPTILRFLELLFDARPVAFQQLLFQRSNGHPLHQDTAYVCVDQPLWLAATWIALEDVVQGRGELTYFEGSHKIPHYLFKDGSKRFNAAHDDPAPFSRHIAEELRAHGCKKHDFLARKGDVFLWSADLVHGSNPRTRPEEETRRSCVTHYCPETTKPFWFRVFKGCRGLQAWGERALIASSYYRLPKGPGIVRPSFLLPERPPGKA